MVKRYELKADYDCGEMVPLSDGTYVLYSDYAHLEALIADAPHSKDCPRSSKHSSFLSCNCFKSRALDTKEKSNG